MRVLICDDEPDIRTVYRMAFEQEGAEVDEAGDGDECLLVAADRHPDVIVLDLYMPGRDGFATLPLLRASCPQCAILVVTAHAAVEVFDRSRSRGATACFDKVSFLPRIPRVLERFGPAA